MGLAFDNLRDYQKAAYTYQQCLRMNSRVGEAWNNLGAIMQKSGNSTAALNDYRQAASLGDSLGRGNYQALQNAIRQAQAAAQRGGTPNAAQLQTIFAMQKAGAYSANHPEASWSESMSIANQH